MVRKALAWLLTAVMALLILLNIGLTLMEREVPLYHLDSANLTDWVEMPPHVRKGDLQGRQGVCAF